MMIRRYVVKDIPEAVVMIRRELGKDAVILNTRKVWAKRFGGLWRSRRVEVVAATGDDVPRREFPSGGGEPVFEKSVTQRNVAQSAGVRTRAEAAAASVVPSSVSAVGVPSTAATGTAATGTAATGTVADTELRRLWAELSDLKLKLEHQTDGPGKTHEQRLEQSGSAAQSAVEPPADSCFSQLFNHLQAQGVNEIHVERLIQQCRQSAEAGSKDHISERPNFEVVRQVFVNVVKDTIGRLAEPRPLSSDSRIIGVVGPTGVGKTTTIAKLAALHVLEGQRKVGLITTDTFRIAAVEQLRTYANILGIPLQVVYQEEDIETAFAALADRDLILVDTAGRNFSNPKHVHETHELLDKLGCDEVHLILSLTSKPDDLEALTQTFQDLPVTQVVLTKLDETRSYGSAVNLLMDFKRPLSYMTMGQNVPDDIAVASTEKLLRLTAGGARF